MRYFSEKGYIDLIDYALRSKYEIYPVFAGHKANSNLNKLLLRHDVDFSLVFALKMAELEAKKGIRSTYYVMTTGQYYNLYNKENIVIIKKLVELGHELGLHWSIPQNCKEDLVEKAFLTQLYCLESISGIEIKSCAQHLPTQCKSLNVSKWIEIDCYQSAFLSNYEYFSDSSMKWREKEPIERFSSKKDLLFLSHPIWWMSEYSLSLFEKIDFAKKQKLGEVESEFKALILSIEDGLQNRDFLDNRFKSDRNFS